MKVFLRGNRFQIKKESIEAKFKAIKQESESKKGTLMRPLNSQKDENLPIKSKKSRKCEFFSKLSPTGMAKLCFAHLTNIILGQNRV